MLFQYGYIARMCFLKKKEIVLLRHGSMTVCSTNDVHMHQNDKAVAASQPNWALYRSRQAIPCSESNTGLLLIHKRSSIPSFNSIVDIDVGPRHFTTTGCSCLGLWLSWTCRQALRCSVCVATYLSIDKSGCVMLENLYYRNEGCYHHWKNYR